MSNNVEYIISLRDKFSTNISKMGNSMKKFESSIANMGGVIGQLGMTLGAVGIGSSILKSSMDLEDALASLSAITGVSGSEFENFKVKINQVAASTGKFSGDVAKAFELIGSAQPELLKSADGLAKVSEAAIVLSKASRSSVEEAASNITSAMNQFSLGAGDATRTINVLSAGAVVGAANISEVTEAMKNVGTVAATSNMSLEETVAAIEVLGKYQLKGVEAGTKLRGSIVRLQQAGLGYKSGQFKINDALKEAKLKTDSLGSALKKDAYLTELFGMENLVAGQIMIKNIALFKEYTKGVTNTSSATEMAAKNSNTLSARFSKLIDSFKNITTSSNASSGALRILSNLMDFLTKNMEAVLGVVAALVISYATLRVGIIAYEVAVKAAAIGTRVYAAAVKFMDMWNKRAIASTNLLKTTMVKTGVGAIVVAAAWGVSEAMSSAEQETIKAKNAIDKINKKYEKIKANMPKGKAQKALDKFLKDKKEKEAKLKENLNVNEGSTETKETKITSSAPKVFNINIDKLVENFTVSTSTLKESTNEIKEAVLNALLGSLNDTQIVLNQ